MSLRRLLLGAALIAAAVVVTLGGLDVRTIRGGIAGADARFAEGRPPGDGWEARGRLPGAPARRLLGVGDDTSLRLGVQLFRRARAGRSSFDNGVSATRARAAAEVQLVDAERRNIGRAASLAANLLGVLEFDDSVRRATNAPAPVERSLAEFENAVRADPANVEAKYNLELLLRSLQAKGVRPGQTSGVGNAPGGHQGAGSSPPGRGY